MTTFKKNEYGAYTDGRWLIYKETHCSTWAVKTSADNYSGIINRAKSLKAAIAYCEYYDNY